MKTTSKILNNNLKSPELKEYKKDIEEVEIIFSRKKKGKSGYYFGENMIVFSSKYECEKAAIIHELTHYKDAQKSEITHINKENYFEYRFSKKYANKLLSFLYQKKYKITKKDIEELMKVIKEKKIRKKYFEKYKEASLYSMFLDIFNSITGGKYNSLIFGYNGSHNESYYKKGGWETRYLEINADFSALIAIMGKDKIKEIFTKIKKEDIYKEMAFINETARKNYIK